ASRGVVKLWRLADAALGRVLSRAGAVSSLGFSPDGAWLVGGGGDGNIRVWPTTGDGAPRMLPNGSPVRGALFLDADSIATADDDGFVKLWRLTEGTVSHMMAGDGAFSALTLARDGSILAA